MISPSSCSHPSWFVLQFPFFFFFFLLISSQLSLVRSAGVYQKNQSCADYHSECGDVSIHNPFSDPRMEEECGLGIIDCVNDSAQLTIPMDDGFPHRFEVKSINYSDNTIVVHDRHFTDIIRQNNCDALYNFSLPWPSSSSVQISFQLIQPAQNITFRICEERPTNDITSQYDIHGLEGIRACGENHVLHFFNRLTALNKDSLDLDYCKLVDFPADLSVPAKDLLDRLSKGFRLQWHLPNGTACRECPHNNNNTLCWKDNQGQLLCAEDVNHQDTNKSKVTKRFITIAIGSILTVMFTIAVIVVWHL